MKKVRWFPFLLISYFGPFTEAETMIAFVIMIILKAKFFSIK